MLHHVYLNNIVSKLSTSKVVIWKPKNSVEFPKGVKLNLVLLPFANDLWTNERVP
jgi:predicted DNA-binding transcriptional regulator AlpA